MNDTESEKLSGIGAQDHNENGRKGQKGQKEGKEEEAEEEEEDYMSMIIQEPDRPKQKETSMQRRARKERQAEINSRGGGGGKTREDRKADEVAAQEAAFDNRNKIDASNKGFKLLAKLGYKPGEALGKKLSVEGKDKDNASADATFQFRNQTIEPIRPVLKADRGGIGLESEKKRKLREEMETETKRVKTEQGDYRERMRVEREERRLEAQVIAAQKIAENFDTEMEDGDGVSAPAPNTNKPSPTTKPLKSINILWRGLIRSRSQNERERRMRHDLQQHSLSGSSAYTYKPTDDDHGDADIGVDIKTLGQAERRKICVEEELEEEDSELDAFNALPPQERLAKLVLYLRNTYFYCFWCKYRYPNNENMMEDCPGIKEEDHD